MTHSTTGTPHGSFQTPRPGADKLPRVSTEVAVLVVY